jgi:hypothetical protein
MPYHQITHTIKMSYQTQRRASQSHLLVYCQTDGILWLSQEGRAIDTDSETSL